MMRTVYGLATPNTEFLRPFDCYQAARRHMHMGDKLYQRTVIEIEYDIGTYANYGEWHPVVVPGISHCYVCQTKTDLAPGWCFDEMNLYCVNDWCHIYEARVAEIRWTQMHKNDKQAA